ncbi:MAG TPA: response regulator [Chryseolinea sp.]|nr:response regulator [Chryseolinea sp.]
MNTEIEILLAEDKQSDAEMTIRAIRKNRVQNKITHVTDGKAVLDFLFGEGKFLGRDTSNQPRFILLDLKMPKLNGIEVLKRIRENDLTKTIPVVVLTSSKEDPDIEQCYLLGVNSYIVKPVVFEDFMKVVSDVGLYWILHNQPPL